MHKILFFGLIIFFVTGAYASTGASGPVPNKFVVRLKPQIDPAHLNQALGRSDIFQQMSRLQLQIDLDGTEAWERTYVLHFDGQALSEVDVVSILGKDNIEFVEPDYYLEFFDLPHDSLFSNQWYLYNVGQPYLAVERVAGPYNDELITRVGIPGKDIRLIDIYQAPPAQTTRVVVAIVDSGIDLMHPELEGRIWRNNDEIPYNGIDDDHNGIVDDTIGYDVSGDVINILDPTGDIDPTDIHGHGTHCAGLVASNADGVGIVGVAPWVELMPVKIRPNGTSAVGAAGILYAVNAGAKIINVSWGTPFESVVLKDAIDFARRNGVLVCIAPGNTGDNTRFYPAAFDSTFVVGAGNSDGLMTDFSTYGAHIDLIAPGQDILSLRAADTDMYGPYPGLEPDVRIIADHYYLADGTSMATPIVAGAAALLLSVRPDLSLEELQDALLHGATDLLDPLSTGEFLPGPDTICGYGYLNIDASLALLEDGSVFIVEPIHRNRYESNIPIKIASVAGYSGGWSLEYAWGLNPEDWIWLASGASVPSDSLACIFDATNSSGFLSFRLTDDNGSISSVTIVYVRSNHLEITSPINGEELFYSIPIYGSVYGPDFDSVIFSYRDGLGSLEWLGTSTGEFFDSLMFDWSVSGSDTGHFVIYVDGFFGEQREIDSVAIHVSSAFALGWPQHTGGRGGMTPVCADLNHDGVNEVIVPTTAGLAMYRGDNGQVIDGFPILPNKDMRCVPAIYDVDGDGWDEIIATNTDGIHIIHWDGTPIIDDVLLECYTGLIAYEYAYPNPTIGRLRVDAEQGATPDSAILILNKLGQVLAYRFDGEPYFFGLEGLFAQFSDRISFSYGIGGGTSPFVAATNLDDDEWFEVIASYSSPYPYTGLGVFGGADGQPVYGDDNPTVLSIPSVYGTVLTDLDEDNLPEIVVAGWEFGMSRIWALTRGVDNLPGWPVDLPSVVGWIGSYPIAADLDLDGSPEILVTFFEFDIASLFIFRADGTPYVSRDGRPVGEAFSAPMTFGTPGVANLLGDTYPEIIFRSGYILPGTGPEQLHILDHNAVPIPGWPRVTPARSSNVVSSRYAPLVDDIDGDGLVELALLSDGHELLVWNFEASIDDGSNTFRFLGDNLNSGQMGSVRVSTDIDDGVAVLPRRVSLRQNYPNPFNPKTRIVFSVPTRRYVKLTVYNILGQEVQTLMDGEVNAGSHEVDFIGSDYATGVYLYRLEAGKNIINRKMLLIK
ncbi:MAG: S8 family peptidase [candidate division Zixibacteria bacterium]|nr:S8 family peptidase [candidate division Zixibacteria bacterium]